MAPLTLMLKNFVLLIIAIVNAQGAPSGNYWNGKWFPHSPNEPDLNPSISFRNRNHLYDHYHGVAMGVADASCDDAKTNLDVDWFMNPINFTCFDDKSLYLPKSTIHPFHSVEHIPLQYMAPHKCMNNSIIYGENIPTFGTHRPLWAMYGEYTFLPRQRWVHNLEHGGVVMLYHPCANKNQIKLLQNLVKSCLYRHVITPYNLMTPERPLALVTWGHRLEMSKVASEVVVKFIKKHALHGPEQTSRDGQYNLMLIKSADVVSDPDDTNLCPNYNNINMK